MAWRNRTRLIKFAFKYTQIMALQKQLGIAIKQLRNIQGLSQEKLAYETGVGRRYMSDIENGTRNISIDVLERIAKGLSMRASGLLNEAEKIEDK